MKKTREFVRVIRGGKKVKTSFFTLSYQETPSQFLRLGIVVPKRVFKRAHDRNKAKRWIRETFRREKHRLKSSYDLAVQVTHAPKDFYFHEVREELMALFEKAGLIQ